MISPFDIPYKWDNQIIMPFLKKDFIYFFYKQGKGGRKKGRETSMCGCLLSAPIWGSGLQPRQVA